jgi:hypothetical protein
MEEMMTKFGGAACFASLDLQSGFNQIALAEDSRELYGLITQDTKVMPVRVPQGCMNATAHFQSQVQLVLGDYYGVICVLWVDDLVVWANDHAQLLERLLLVWGRLNEAGFKGAAHKVVFYTEAVKWCGRYADGEGVWHDPQRIQGLVDMRRPQNAGELMQFLCAMLWMRQSLPEVIPTVAPLQDLLTAKLEGTKKKTKKEATRVVITEEEWQREGEKAFADAKSLLSQAIKLAHPQLAETHITCVFTDASDLYYGVTVTQIPREDITKPVADQRHMPLACLSNKFKAAQLNWSVTDKEAWPILVAFQRLKYLLWGDVYVFCDHRNIIYIYAHSTDVHVVCKATSRRLGRWAVLLGAEPFKMFHIAGELNVWGDLLSRWIEAPIVQHRQAALVQTAGDGMIQEASDDLPTLAVIMHEQQEVISVLSADVVKTFSEGGLKPVLGTSNGLFYVELRGSNKRCLWIPTAARALQQRLLVVAHSGSSGHRGVEATRSRLDPFWWEKMEVDIKEFVQRCLNCVDAHGGAKVPRPLGEHVHGTAPTHVLHFDFFHLGAAKNNATLKYLLVLYDDFSQMVWLEPAAAASSEMAARGILEYCAAYGVPKIWVSDNGSHFKNEVLGYLREALGSDHRFGVANVPFSNGTSERMVKEAKKCFKAVLLEHKRHPTDWVPFVKVVQYALNTAHRQRLGYTPYEIMFGRQSATALSAILLRDFDEVLWQVKPVDTKAIQQHCSGLIVALAQMHRKVEERHVKQRQRSRDHASRGALPNFSVGDFVLRAIVRKAGKHAKLASTWVGPSRITAAGTGHVFTVQHLVTGELSQVHVSRLRFYADSLLEVTTELKEQVQQLEAFGVFEMERLVAVRITDQVWYAHVAWSGFEEAEWTWEPLSQLLADRESFVVRQLQQLNLTTATKKAISRAYAIRL